MAGHVQDRLHPGAHHEDRSAGEHAEVGGDVERGRAPRCTPPSPPVANTAMPARWAKADVDATVVAPLLPSATATPTSRTDSLADVRCPRTVGPGRIRQARSARGRPARRWWRERRRSTATADLDLVGDPAVVAAGQAVSQDRRLQCHHPAACGERVGDLGVHRERVSGWTPDGVADMRLILPGRAPATMSGCAPGELELVHGELERPRTERLGHGELRPRTAAGARRTAAAQTPNVVPTAVSGREAAEGTTLGGLV